MHARGSFPFTALRSKMTSREISDKRDKAEIVVIPLCFVVAVSI